MFVVTGDGRIIVDLDRDGVIRELQAAQRRGDRYCSVNGAYAQGLDPFEIERAAGYTIGANEAEEDKI